jgi:hypothetical protein
VTHHTPTGRGLLAGFAAVPVAAISAAGTPDADAELVRLCRQHIANVRAYEAGPDRRLDDPDPLDDALDATRAAILQTPAETIAGLVAKARLAAQ